MPNPTDKEADTRAAAINAKLEPGTDRFEERELLELLRDAPALDELLRRVDLDRLFDAVDDRTLGPDHQTALIELLTDTRVGELSLPSRAALIEAFSRGRTPKPQERGIVAVMRATHGRELTALKNLLDRGTDHHDLQHIVFTDIDDHALRRELLEHLEREAEALPRDAIKLLSDIDDTLYANWKDQRFPKQTVYPGVRQLLRELDRGPHARADESGDLAFVTARPGDRPGLVENLTHARLRELGIESATVLAGSWLSIFGDAAIAAGKLADFRDYARLFAEYEFVFIGDNGQGDAEFGARMREAVPDRVRAVLIHEVVACDPSTRASWTARGVELFGTYVGAATLAWRHGLIQRAGVDRVIASAREEFDHIRFETPEQRDARLRELEADIAASAAE